jgi:phosphate uptake regulator
MGDAEEIRKIQLTGKSTYIVSLPKRWVTEMRLRPGDGLRIRRLEDSSLLIIPRPPQKPEKVGEVEVRLLPTDDPYKVARKIVSLYLLGYNLIRLTVSEGRISSTQRETIKQFVRTKLVGTEITTDLPSEMTLQILLSYPELSVKDALRRMCLITTSMQKDAMAALEKLDKGMAKDVIQRDDEVDRFSMYVIRQLKSAVENPRLIKEVGLATARDCLGYRLITKSVERIADHAALVAENVLRLERRVEPALFRKITAMSAFAASLFEDAVESLFKGDYESAEKVIEREEVIRSLENQAVRQMLRKASREDVITLRLITESLRRMAEHTSDIAEIVLNLTVIGALKQP